MPQTLLADAANLLPDLVALRRALHHEPELGLELPKTQAAVVAALGGLDLEVTLGEACTSVVAVLRGGRPGPTVLLRADMDALPIAEPAGLEYAATNGNMHACGHDLHTAALVGAARLLHARRAELAGDVLFMFQPGEEGYDGAAVMLAEGLLETTGTTPIAAFAIHNGPGERGVFSTRPGPILAGNGRLQVTIRGAGGHGSQPHSARNPVPAVAALAGALQTMLTQRFSVFDPVVLSVTQLFAGEAVNVIPESAGLGASVRMVSADAQARLGEEVRVFADGIAAAHGCTAEVDFTLQYPVTVNDAAATKHAIAALSTLLGAERVIEIPTPVMGSEDFSRVLAQVPGTYLFLHSSPNSVNPATAAVNHSPHVLFDDAVLADQAAALAHLAMSTLAGR
ncbi:M20 metallopeptidase family protein [Tomitella biformata]|uniref:M20 metallopeptidase family protein n=1 Tax=Tomitella biformata TaxID=630403 RepID=UPI000466C825|nr:M20 family metallopeptidase [Tomitella biformata]